MKRSTLGLALVPLLIAGIAAAADSAAVKTVIEISKPKPRPQDGLSTIEDVPTEKESPFRKKVTEKPLDLWAGLEIPPAEGEKPDPAAEAERKKAAKEASEKLKTYTLAGQAGQYVGWFGIVRGVHWDDASHRTELTLQHCYYDDSTDAHQQIVSIFGAGDFTAYVSEKTDRIPPLGLVRVYGKVTATKAGEAQVAAEYVRVWDWGLFAFMDYGLDKTNKKWRAMRKVKDEDAYTAAPKATYYEARLGKRDQPTTKPANQK